MGSLRLSEITPNAGGFDRLFLLDGDAISAPIAAIENTDLLPEATGNGRLQIFHFNDLHNHLTELSGADKGTHRLAQMVKRVADARREGGAVLFLGVGDDHTGSVFDELMGWSPEQFILDASYRAFSNAGVDLTVLGNHEFDRGAELLAMGIEQDAKFPILSTNAHGSAFMKSGQHYHTGAIAIAGGLRIGLIGLTTHVETRVGQPSDPNFSVASPMQVLENILPALAPLVDLVLILSHCGYGDGSHKSGKAAAVRDIGEADFSIAKTAARLTDKPLLLLGAHTHTRLNQNGLEESNVFAGIPIFQAECNGAFLGEIDLTISPQGYDLNNVTLHPVKSVTDGEQPEDYDQVFETNHIAPIIAKVHDNLTRKIAIVETADLGFETAVLQRYSGESALLNFMCDAVFTRLDDAGYGPDLVMMNGATAQAGIETGPLSMGNWFNVVPYADQVFILDITHLELQQILQNNAKRILRPEEIPHTDYAGFLPRGFVHFSRHIRYEIAIGTSATDAISSVGSYCGVRLDTPTDKVFRVAMPTYLALGAFGENWNGKPISGGVPGHLPSFDLRQLPMKNTSLVYRDVIAAQIRSMGKITTPKGGYCDGRLLVNELKMDSI